MSYGRQVLGTAGRGFEISVDGKPEMKSGGVTIDWSTVTAVSGSAVTLLDGVTVEIGQKYLAAGQVITKITASGKYGPYDVSPVSDGRQTLAKGRCFIVARTVINDDPKAEHAPALEGGKVWRDMVKATTGTASLADGPTYATLDAVMPRLVYVDRV